MEKNVTYTNTNSYSVMNSFSNKTENIWTVYHGLGYLSKYFISYFKNLAPTKNYIVAPQAPSKFYQGNDYKYVGASWLTKENTKLETKNVLQYLDTVAKEEFPENHTAKNIFLGFSQGVSVMLRWIAARRIKSDIIVIHSGGIPKELVAGDFDFLSEKTKIFLVYGKADPYLTAERMNSELIHANELFGAKLRILPFEGKHEMNLEIIKKISEDTL